MFLNHVFMKQNILLEYSRKSHTQDDLFLVYCLRSRHNFAVITYSLVGLPDDSSNYVLHISNSMPLCAVRWNPGNQDEVGISIDFHVGFPFFILSEFRKYFGTQYQ